MICPICPDDTELSWDDYFGPWVGGNVGIQKRGDIYRCPSEESEQAVEHRFFYTYTSAPDDLREGYPC